MTIGSPNHLHSMELQERNRRRSPSDIWHEQQPELCQYQHTLHALAVVSQQRVVPADPRHHLRARVFVSVQ